MSQELVKLDSTRTAEGESIAIRTMNGGVMVDKAHVTQADIAASNGVIHVIDTVMLPD